MQARPPPPERISQEFAESASAEFTVRPTLTSAPPLAKQPIDELRRLRVLVEVADTVTQDLSLDRQLPRLIELITEALDAERATLFLYDSDADALFSRVLRGEGVTEIRMPSTAGIAGAATGFSARTSGSETSHTAEIRPPALPLVAMTATIFCSVVGMILVDHGLIHIAVFHIHIFSIRPGRPVQSIMEVFPLL